MSARRPLVAVLDYGIGNLRSAQKALERVGADARLTADVGLIADADGVLSQLRSPLLVRLALPERPDLVIDFDALFAQVPSEPDAEV